MKSRAMALGLMLGSLVSMPLQAEEIDQEGVQSVMDLSQLTMVETLTQLISEHTESYELITRMYIEAFPESADEILAIVMSLLPQEVSSLARLARELGVDNQIITVAAIQAGIDPTLVAEQTAAGIESVSTNPTPTAPIKKSPVSGS